MTGDERSIGNSRGPFAATLAVSPSYRTLSALISSENHFKNFVMPSAPPFCMSKQSDRMLTIPHSYIVALCLSDHASVAGHLGSGYMLEQANLLINRDVFRPVAPHRPIMLAAT